MEVFSVNILKIEWNNIQMEMYIGILMFFSPLLFHNSIN